MEDQFLTYRSLAMVCMMDGLEEAALGVFQDMEQLCIKAGDELRAGETAYMVGLVSEKLGNEEQALEAFVRAGRIAARFPDQNFEAHALTWQLAIYLRRSEAGKPVDSGKLYGAQARLRSIPEDTIAEEYYPPWLFPK